MKTLVVLGAALCACGGAATVDRSSGGGAADASAPQDPGPDAADWRDVWTVSDGSHWDRTVWHDAWNYPEDAAFEEIDGGRDCGLPPDTVSLPFGLGINCCNDEVCRGRCLLFDGWTAPVCTCAHLIGECTAPRVCCYGLCSPDLTCGLM
ncbi:MAG: hypothetical protein IT376_15770 [Polyangiaceae bacterium]|nr:hypothetical protein [Polyangiaceae bacterium]